MKRKKILLAAVVIAVGLTSLVAGLTWQYYSQTALASIEEIDDLREFENQWKSLNSTQPIKVDDWKGKTVLLNFWGSWCPPCIEEMPLLDRFNTKYADVGFQIIGVVLDREEDARQFLKENEIKFPSIIADLQFTNQIIERLGNTEGVLPFTAAFAKSGKRSFTKAGPLDETDLENLVR